MENQMRRPEQTASILGSSASNEGAVALIRRLVTSGMSIEEMVAWLRTRSQAPTPRPRSGER